MVWISKVRDFEAKIKDMDQLDYYICLTIKSKHQIQHFKSKELSTMFRCPCRIRRCTGRKWRRWRRAWSSRTSRRHSRSARSSDDRPRCWESQSLRSWGQFGKKNKLVFVSKVSSQHNKLSLISHIKCCILLEKNSSWCKCNRVHPRRAQSLRDRWGQLG